MAALRNDAPHITCGVSRDLPLRSPPDSFVQSRGHENSPKALQAHSRPSEFDRITNHLILRDYENCCVFLSLISARENYSLLFLAGFVNFRNFKAGRH